MYNKLGRYKLPEVRKRSRFKIVLYRSTEIEYRIEVTTAEFRISIVPVDSLDRLIRQCVVVLHLRINHKYFAKNYALH